MFRRSKSPEATASPDPTSGKGRPTRTRKEAEAEAKARAKAPRSRKEATAARRATMATNSAKMREALKTGEERYLPARDKGPMRRFIRDFVDARLSLVELLLPLLIITMILGYSGNTQLANFGNALLTGTLLVVIFDLVLMRLRLRRQLATRFPGESLKGTTYYAITRALQMKFMRLPKAQVKIGQALPDTYR